MGEITAALDEQGANKLLDGAIGAIGHQSKSGFGNLDPFVASYSVIAQLTNGDVDLIPPDIIRLVDLRVDWDLDLSFGIDLSAILPDFCLPQVCIDIPCVGTACTPKICIDWPTITVPVSFGDFVTATGDFQLDISVTGGVWKVQAKILGVPNLQLTRPHRRHFTLIRIGAALQVTETLDSRAIRRTDCYGQRFIKAGSYTYNILPAHGHLISQERPFIVKVKDGEKKPKMKQHTVLIKCRAGKFVVATEVLTIDVGDLVLWNCADADALPYAVIGDHDFFSSDRLVNECGFSHAFGSAGEYCWTDAYGSGVAGVVKVNDPGCKGEADLRRWRQSLGQGTVVMVTDGKAQPEQVEIQTGQTVFFAVVKAPGISITDE